MPLRRRRTTRRLFLLLCLAVTVVAAVRWYPQARDHVLMQLWQRRCLNHRPPADQIVYTSEPERSDGLMRDGRYHVMDGATRSTFLVPGHWSDLYANVSPPGLKSHGTVFLGRMKTPGGKARLVALDLVIEDPTKDNVLLMARVIEPGSVLGRPRVLSTIGGRFLSYNLLDRPVTPGKMDPNDPGHLLLFDGRIDARLGDDDAVNLSVRVSGGDERVVPPARPATSAAGGG